MERYIVNAIDGDDEHGWSISGLSLMRSAESPGTAFEIFYERFSEQELEQTIFIFDNACKFRKCWFL